MMKVLLALALVIGLAAPGHSAQAQATNTSLDDSLQRLSEILGALHYLRPICGFKEADRWRTTCGRWRARAGLGYSHACRAGLGSCRADPERAVYDDWHRHTGQPDRGFR